MVEESLEVDHRVEQIIVVADDGVAPGGEIQPQLEGAELLFLRPVLDHLAGEGVLLPQHLEQDILHPVVVAPRVGAVVGVAQPLLQKADLVLGGQRHPL